MMYYYHNPVQIAILVWGAVFCLLAAICIGFGRNLKKEKRIWMTLMQLSTALLLGSDALAWMFRGADDAFGYHMVRISHFCVFIVSIMILTCFHTYVCNCLLNEEEKGKFVRVKAGYGICIIASLLVVVSQFTHWYYYFDAQNYYHRGKYYVISLLLPLLGMTLDASLMVKYRKRISKNELTAMGTYIILPFAAGMYQVFYYGVPLINVCTGISMIIMFVMEMLEQSREMEALARNKQKTEEELEIAMTLNQCVAELSSNADIDVAINNLLEVIRIYFAADRTYIFECDHRKEIVINTYECVKDQVSVQIENLQEVPVDILAEWMEKFEQGEPYYISDIEEKKDTKFYDIIKGQDIHRLLAVPLIRNKEVIGFLGVDNPMKHYDDATLLSSLQFFVRNSLETKKQQEKLQYLSYRDMLTNLYNRNKYMRMLEKYENETIENVGIVYMDLNGLKKINDKYGHEAGDRLIIRAGRAVKEVFGEYAYRIGGDEFVVVAFPIGQEQFEQEIKQLKNELHRRDVNASMGIVWADVTEDLEEMLKTADHSMYEMKKEYHRQMQKMKD